MPRLCIELLQCFYMGFIFFYFMKYYAMFYCSKCFQKTGLTNVMKCAENEINKLKNKYSVVYAYVLINFPIQTC